MHNGIARISGHKHDLQRRLTLYRFIREFATVHTGHDNVGQQQFDGFGFVEQAERFVGSARGEHVITESAQRLDDIAAHVGLVLDDEDAFAETAAADFALDVVLRDILADEAPQIDFEGRAFPDLAVDLHVAAGLLDKAIDLTEAEAGALAGLLGGKKRLESAIDNFSGHAL